MATKESVVGGPEPGSSWGPFETLKPIPRPSRHEAPAIVHVREWADRQAFELEQDAARKIVIRVPGRRGATHPHPPSPQPHDPAPPRRGNSSRGLGGLRTVTG